MTNRKKERDKRIWKRMGFEFALLEGWIRAILCDSDYNEVMDKKTWDRWYGISSRLNVLRSECENRMASKVYDWSTEIFYPEAYDRTAFDKKVQTLRQKFKSPNRRNAGMTGTKDSHP